MKFIEEELIRDKVGCSVKAKNKAVDYRKWIVGEVI
jgi:hypothetical protein